MCYDIRRKDHRSILIENLTENILPASRRINSYLKWLYHTYFCKVLKCDRAFLAIEEKVYKIRNSVKYINKVFIKREDNRENLLD